MKKILSLLFVLSSYLSYSQCSYPVANTQASIQTFCVNNPGQSINVTTRTDRFVTVNVVQGFQYTFSVGDVYTTLDENINVYDGTTNAQIISATGATGTSINWTATFSGNIKIIVSQGACDHTNTSNVTLTLTLTGVGNTFDDLTTSGTNTWVGHVYNWLGTSPPPGGSTSPATPQNTFPFLDTNYVGYYNVSSESLLENFGGNNVCFPVLSNGINRTNIRTEVFAVRYRMLSTRPAGCYIISMRGDDGIRLYNDGALVFSEWKQQSPTNYNNVLVYLDGNAELIFDFYENGGQNVADLSIQPFNAASNTVATPANTTVCNNVSPGVLDGSSFAYNGGTINPTIAFQWQVSTDNITFTNIVGATSENYTPPAISNPGPSNVVRYYRRVIGATSSLGSCDSPSNSIIITTSPNGAPPTAISANAITCTSFTANWNAIANATSYVLDVATSSSFTAGTFVTGYTALNVGNVTSLNITGLTNNTTYYYRVRAVYSCGTSNVSNSIQLTTTAFSGPVAQPATAISCNGFTANWSAIAGATSYVIDVATTSTFTAGTFIVGYQNLNVGNSLSINLTNIYNNPIYYRLRALGPCGTSSNSSVITVTRAITTWNGTTWSNGAPDLSKLAIINGNYDTTSNGDFECCSLLVNATFTLNIQANDYVLIQNDLTNNGTLNVLNNGSLVQVNDLGVNTGNISYQRIASVKLQDYVYWSSPVSGFDVNSISPATPAYYHWEWNPTIVNPNGGEGNWVNASTTMLGGKGYIVRAPNGFSNSANQNWTATFNNGVPNNGVYTPTIARGTDLNAGTAGPNGVMRLATDDNWNLLGNPYPSSISINSFLASNPQLDGFIRLWTHGTLPSTAILDPFYDNFVSNYTAGDYIALNGSGATSGPGAPGVIGAGQGFFVLMNPGAATTSTALFNNAMRSKNYSNSHFYRNASAANSGIGENIVRHRIWLDLVSPTNETTRTLVAYVDGATAGKDRMFDAFTDYKLAQNFYSLIDDQVMVIQGKGLPFEQEDRVPLGLKIPSNGIYKIAIATVDGLFSGNQNIYLEDKVLGVIHDLRQNPYSFTGVSGIVNDRFVLRYTNETLGGEDFINNSDVLIFSSDVISVNAMSRTIQNVKIYNVLGQLLLDSDAVNSDTFETSKLQKNNTTLLVQVTLENGIKVTKKIVF